MKYQLIEYDIATETGPVKVRGYKVGKYTAIRKKGSGSVPGYWVKDHIPTGRKIPIGITHVRRTARLICLAFEKEATGRGVSLSDSNKKLLTKKAASRIKAYGLLINQQLRDGKELDSYEDYLEAV